MRSVLVTGGAGFIGSHFAARTLATESVSRLVVYDLLTYAGNRNNLASIWSDPRFVFKQGDICDGESLGRVFSEYGIDTVVNFAAESHVDRSNREPSTFVRSNVLGVSILLDVAEDAWSRSGEVSSSCRFHQVSTDEVYGPAGKDEAPAVETSALRPSSPYAASKAGADLLVLAHRQKSGMNLSISRSSNTFGRFQHPEKLIPHVVSAAVSGKPIPVYGSGENFRTWMHVDDHCRAIQLILDRRTDNNVFNVKGREELQNIKLVRLVCELVDNAFAAESRYRKIYPDAPAAAGGRSSCLVSFVDDRPAHDFRYAMDTALAKDCLGFATLTDFRAALLDSVIWQMDNPEWWPQDKIPQATD